MESIGEASTKLLLFGEHSAVYGYPALGIPLPWKMTIQLKPAKTFHWIIPLAEDRHLQIIDALLPKLPLYFPELTRRQPFSLTLLSDAPIGIGFGSSGALCVALVKAIHHYLNLSIDPQDIWRKAHQIEMHFHHRPSGVDTGISTWNKEGYFEKSISRELPNFHPIAQGKRAPLIVGALNRSLCTAELICSLGKKLVKWPELMEHIKQLGNITKKAASTLQHPDLFGQLALEAQYHLKALGLSTPEMDVLLSHAVSIGATGGKLSGAGGGGAYFIVCPTTEAANRIKNELSSWIASQQIPHALSPSVI
jgi:mevalonate kinase